MYTKGSSELVFYKLKYAIVFKNLNKYKQILISFYVYIHLQNKVINGRTRKHIKSCLILIYLKICISGQFTPPTFKALKKLKTKFRKGMQIYLYFSLVSE